MTEVSSVKAEYRNKELILARTQAEADRLKAEAEATRTSQNELVKQKATEMYQSKEKSLKSAYEGKEYALHGAFFGTLAYAILVTLFTAIDSRAFVSDFKAFFAKIADFIVWLWNSVSIMAKWASQIGDKIPQTTVAFLVHWLIIILVFVLVGGGIGALVSMGAVKLFRWYVEKMEFADNISLAVCLVSLAITIFFADEIRSILPVNLLLLNILIHVLYTLIRWYVTGCRQNRGYY